MGWLIHTEKLRHETPVEYITRRFSHDNETMKMTVLAAAAVRGTIYAAIRNENTMNGDDRVFCAVIPFVNTERGGFGYKAMDESMGPGEVDCPDRIMRLLTPVAQMPNPSYAADWRARVAAAKARRAALRDIIRKLSVGDVILLPQAVQFSGHGISADTFAVVGQGRGASICTPLDHPMFRCRLRREDFAKATINR